MSFSSSSSSRLRNWTQPIQLFLRLIAIGLGCSVITGTSLRLISSKLDHCSPLKSLLAIELMPNFGKLPPLLHLTGTTRGFPLKPYQLNRKLLALSKSWSILANKQPGLTASGFLLQLDNGHYAELNADVPLPAGNLIKIPVLLVAMDQIDTGYLDSNSTLVPIKAELDSKDTDIENNVLSFQPKVNQVMSAMIRLNNNIATNLLIKQLESRGSINKSFETLGLLDTVIMHSLPDLSGKNTISVRDLVHIQAIVITGLKLGLIARDLFQDLMITTLKCNKLTMGIPQDMCHNTLSILKGLPTKGVTLYNKVDNSSTVYAETGLVSLPRNQQIIAIFIVKGPLNSTDSNDLIRSLVASIAPVFEHEE